MQIENEILLDSPPVVPAAVRNQLNTLMKSTTRIVIDERVDENKTRKINSIKLTNRPEQYPREPLEEIAEAVVGIMHDAWSRQETEDPELGPPPMEFVVTCEHYKGNGRKRVRNQFSYTYMGEREADYVEETLSLEDRSIQRAFELLERMLNQQSGVISEYQDRFLRIVEQNTSQAAAGSAMLQQAIPMMIAGMQSQLNAKVMEYDAAKHDANERAKTERWNSVLQALAPFLGAGMKQFIRHKMGVTESEPAQTDDEATDELDETPPEHPLAEMARYFGDSLRSDQRRFLNETLSKKQQKIFDDLFCSATDADALEGYRDVVEHAADKLGALQKMLDDDQSDVLMAFIGAVSRMQ